MNTNELRAWLLCCQRDFNREYDTLIYDRVLFDNFCRTRIESKNLPKAAASHLALFLLGNQKNDFDKALANNIFIPVN